MKQSSLDEVPRRALLASLAMACIALPASAETKRIVLSDDACEYEFRYDPAKNSEASVRQTFKLLQSTYDVSGPVIVSPKDLSKIDVAEYDRQCAEKLADAADAPTTPMKGLDEYKRAILGELADFCNFTKAQLRGYRDPSALLAYGPAAQCSSFVDALAGKTDVRSAYEKLARSTCLKNANVVACLQRWKAESKDGQWLRLNIVNFGWTNCATKFLKVNTTSNEPLRSRLYEDFKQEFKAKPIHCDDND
jgi:hypothetical protein